MEKEAINSYLIFKLGNEEFAANAGSVLHILELVNITEVPNSPDFMKGVINLRGSVLPVIDTRIKFGLSSTDMTSNTCIIVFEVKHEDELVQVGALVDSVQSVIEIEKGDIKAPPTIKKTDAVNFITGMVEQNEKFIMIIDTSRVFSTEEILDLKMVNKSIEMEAEKENAE